MTRIVRIVVRLLLWALTCCGSFAIACAYGMFYSYSRGGRVLDAVSRAGIPGIRVACHASGVEGEVASTAADGSFTLRFDACEEVVAEDIDGAANGSYASRTVPLPASGDVLIELTPVP